jgi:acetyl-CoA C-acetyltransferase
MQGYVLIFELHDASTIITALSLEAARFAKPGEGVYCGKQGEIVLDGTLPISTTSGLTAHGHPVGVTGVYQLVETYLQRTETTGANQVKDPTLLSSRTSAAPVQPSSAIFCSGKPHPGA